MELPVKNKEYKVRWLHTTGWTPRAFWREPVSFTNKTLQYFDEENGWTNVPTEYTYLEDIK